MSDFINDATGDMEDIRDDEYERRVKEHAREWQAHLDSMPVAPTIYRFDGEHTPQVSGRPQISGLIRRGDLVGIAAPRGIGKSWAAMNLTEIMATYNGFLFDQFPAAAHSRVLYCHGELFDDQATEERWNIVMRDAGKIPPHHIGETFTPFKLRVAKISRPGPELDTRIEEPVAIIDHRLVEKIESGDHDVVILDPWRAFLVGGESDNDDVAALLTDLWDLCRRNEVTLIVIHHFAKDVANRSPEDAWRGASTLADRASVRITMWPYYPLNPKSLRKENKTLAYARRFMWVYFLLRGQRTPTDITVELDPETMRWKSWVPPHEVAAEKNKKEIPMFKLLDTFHRHGDHFISLREATEAFEETLGDEAVTRETLKKILASYGEGESAVLEVEKKSNSLTYELLPTFKQQSPDDD